MRTAWNMLASLDRRRLLVCFGILLALEVATIGAFCGQLFGCGCTLTTGMTHCNIYTGEGAPCPWCSHGWAGFYLPFAVIVMGSAAGMIWSLKRASNSLVQGLVGGLAGYLLWGSLVGLVTAVYYDHPHIYGWNLDPFRLQF